MSDNICQLGKNYSILDLYLGYHDLYRAKYGEKTAVFCQVGDFFEIYAVINESEEAGPNIYRLAEMLGIQVTRRNKSNTEVNRSNYLMSGFPLSGIQKHVQTLVSNFYTVVVVRQTTPPPNVKREVTEIVSPSMTLSPSTSDANHIIVLMLQYQHPRWSCGIALMDISTGCSMIYEVSSTIEDPCYVFDEITRVFNTYPTKEIVLLSAKIPDDKRAHIMESIGLNQRLTGIHKVWDQYPSAYNKKEYQEAILSKAGIGKGMLSNHIISGMDDAPLATVAMTYLVQFAYDHNPKLVQKLQAPRRLAQENRLTLQYNSAIQLNIVGSNGLNESPLLSMLDRTLTSIGSRLYRDRLLTPIVNTSVLNERYHEIGMYMHENLYTKVRKHLSSILDLERISRRMMAETYHPCDWPSFHASLESGLCIADILKKDGMRKNIMDVMRSYKDVIDLDEASKHLLGDIKGNIFFPAIYPELDNLSKTTREQIEKLQQTVVYFSNLCGDATICKIDCNDRDGYFLSATKKRWDAIRQRLPEERAKDYHAKPISAVSNTLRITSPEIESASDLIIKSQARISTITHEKYIEFLREFIHKNDHLIHAISYDIAHIDVQATNAINAIEYRYARPTLLSGETGCASIKQLRHPIIERIQQKIDYVANDVCLSGESPGLLLYGVNASGKSSLMKAVGLAIIMAQSGMYVPCNEMNLAPYHSIFTRISGNDNIYQGMSSFAVEMTELKNILLRADHKSLVLGDELCAGTESVSAISIVASGIDMLLKKRATSVFATHLHELLEIPSTKNHVANNAVQVAHMHTEVKNGHIVYDRTLRKGSGADTYGIEVCRGLGMPDEFMHMAEQTRKHIMHESSSFVHQKQSRYNTTVHMDMCAVCKISSATETHHIRYQESADEDGFVKGSHIHKNNASNLVPLCNSCHLMEHHGDLKIHGWKQSTHGIDLDYSIYDKKEDITIEKDVANIDDLVCVWKPYLRYTTKGWMLKKASRFRQVKRDLLLEELGRVKGIPSCLLPTTIEELEQLQTRLLDVSL